MTNEEETMTEKNEAEPSGLAVQFYLRTQEVGVDRPWQVMIDYDEEVGHLYLMVREHTHGSVAFSKTAATYCGGPAEEDEDGYVIRCHEELQLVDAAREIARMSEDYDAVVAECARWKSTALRLASEGGACENAGSAAAHWSAGYRRMT